MWDARDTCKMHRHSPTYVIRHARVGAKSEVTVHTSNYILQTTQSCWNPNSKTWNPIGRSWKAPPPVLSPSSILPPPSLTTLSSPQGKFRRGFQTYFIFFLARAQNSGKRLLASSRLSICPHGTTRIPLNGFSWKLIFEFFFFLNLSGGKLKFNCNLTWITGTQHKDRYTFWSYFAQFFLT